MRLLLPLAAAACLLLPIPLGAAPGLPDNPKPAVQPFTIGAPLPSWAQPLAEVPRLRHKDARAYLLRETQAVASGPHAGGMLINLAKQANERSELPFIGQHAIEFNTAFKRLAVHRIAIIRDGKVLDRTASVNARLLAPEGSKAPGDGVRELQLLVDDVQPGDTLWLTYVLEGRNPAVGDKWFDRFSLDGGAATTLRKLTLLSLPERALAWRQLGDTGAPAVVPTTDTAGGLKRTVFELRDTPALENEEGVPSDLVPYRMLEVSEYRDWAEVAAWAAGLFPPVEASPALDALAGGMRKHEGEAARALAALQWVQDEIRSFYLPLAEGARKPDAPDLVIQRGYGEPKDKAYLLASLLQRLGLRATPVLGSWSAPALPAKTLPSPEWLNYVVVKVEIDGQPYFVDPSRTDEKGPIALRNPALAGAWGLEASPGASGLVRLPRQSLAVPGYEYFVKMTVQALDKPATMETRDVYRGYAATWARSRVSGMSRDELQGFVLAAHEKSYPGIAIDGQPKIVEPGDGSVELVSRFTLAKPEVDGAAFRVPYNSRIIDGTLGIPDKVVRKYPLALAGGRLHARYHLDLTWPDNALGEAHGAAAELKNGYLHASEEYTWRANHVQYEVDYVIHEDIVKAADVPGLDKSASDLRGMVSGTFKLNAMNVVPEDRAGFPVRELEDLAYVQGIGQRTAWDLSRLDEDDADSACRDIATWHWARAALAPEPRMDRWLSQVDTQGARAAPSGARCLFRLRATQGRFAEAVAIHDRLRKPFAKDDDLLPLLAWSRLHAGDAKRAVADMQRWLDQRSPLTSSELAGALALYQLAGQPAPASLTERAGRMSGTLHPHKVVHMLMGRLSPQQLVEQAGALPERDRDYALDEAWLRIAQHHLARGERDAALEALRWYPANGLRAGGNRDMAMALLWHLEESDADYQAGIAAAARGERGAAADLLARAAGRGVAAAMAGLGKLHEEGEGVPRDIALAVEWYRRAAAAGNADAMHRLGTLHEGGNGVAQDKAAALEWYRKAARHGHRLASYRLGQHYRNTRLGDHASEAFRHFHQAARLGNMDAAAMVARLYRSEYGVKMDDRLAAYWSRMAAQAGNREGMGQYGIALFTGLGAERDVDQAVPYLRQAAEAGDADGQLYLGMAHETGQGVEKDMQAALSWYTKAASNGNFNAMFVVGRFHEAGRLAAPDFSAAREWYEKARGAGATFANRALARVYRDGLGVPKDTARALEYMRGFDPGYLAVRFVEEYHIGKNGWIDQEFENIEQAMIGGAEDGIPMAQHQLGLHLLETGRPQEALGYLREAAAGGEASSFGAIGYRYIHGDAVAKDPWMAYVYLGISVRLRKEGATRDEAAEAQAEVAASLDPARRRAADALVAAWRIGDALPTALPTARAAPAAKRARRK